MVGAGLDLDRAAGHVVADGVVHEVGGEALDQDPIAEGGSSGQVGFDDDSWRLSAAALVWSMASCAAASRSTEFSGGQAAVGPGQGQEAVDDRF